MNRVLLAGGLLILAAGCGGSGGSTVVVPLTSQTRQLQAGDSWTYSFSGVETPTNGSPISINGTSVQKVQSRTGELVTLTHDDTYLIGNAAFPVHEQLVIKQMADGSELPVSDNLGANQSTRTVLSTTAISPGVLKLPLHLVSTTTYSNGNIEQGDLQVTGTSTIPVTAGVFSTWVVTNQLATNYGYSIQSTSYDVPAIDAAAKKTETVSESGVGVTTATFLLTSTTVPFP